MSDSLVTPWTVAHQAPLSMGFFLAKILESGLPFPSPGDLPDPGIKPISPALQAAFLPIEPPGKPLLIQAHLKFSEKRGLHKRTYRGTRIISSQGQPGG